MSKRTYVPRRPCLYVPFQKTLSFAPGWRVQGGVGGVAHLLAFGKRLTLTSPFPFPHPLWFRIRNVSKWFHVPLVWSCPPVEVWVCPIITLHSKIFQIHGIKLHKVWKYVVPESWWCDWGGIPVSVTKLGSPGTLAHWHTGTLALAHWHTSTVAH